MAIYPCKGCTKRERLCHSHCEEYKKAKEAQNRARERQREEDAVIGYEKDRYIKRHWSWMKHNGR